MSLEQLPCRLIIPSDMRLLGVARTFLETFCRAGGLDASTTNAVVLAVDEAINNIIRHGHLGRIDALVEIECRLLPNAIEIRLTDEGKPFDITAVPHLDPAELRVGGRGVYLMRTLMDELSTEPREPRGNVLRMVKRCLRNPAVAATP